MKFYIALCAVGSALTAPRPSRKRCGARSAEESSVDVVPEAASSVDVMPPSLQKALLSRPNFSALLPIQQSAYAPASLGYVF